MKKVVLMFLGISLLFSYANAEDSTETEDPIQTAQTKIDNCNQQISEKQEKINELVAQRSQANKDTAAKQKALQANLQKKLKQNDALRKKLRDELKLLRSQFSTAKAELASAENDKQTDSSEDESTTSDSGDESTSSDDTE